MQVEQCSGGALGQGIGGVQAQFRLRDPIGAGLQLPVQVDVAVGREVPAAGVIRAQSLFGDGVRAGALDDPQRLPGTGSEPAYLVT